MTPRVRVLFVCLGNICRSPLAEGVFRHLVAERGLMDRFEIDSAGTSAHHVGEPPDSRSAATARLRGIELRGSSRQVRPADFQRFDYLIAMDRTNVRDLSRMARGVEVSAAIQLLREWDQVEPGGDVPDPYYGGAGGFDRVQEIVERSCEALLAKLEASLRAE